jgi:uncharacterized protein
MKKSTIVLYAGILFCMHAIPCYAVDILTSGGLRIKKKVACLKEVRGKSVVKQSLDYSCGPAALATILNNYLNDSVTEKEIISQLLKTTSLAKVKQRKGFSLLDLKRFLEAKGYIAQGFRMDINYLRTLDQPVLVPIKFKNYRHFVVVKFMAGNRVFVADPTLGNMIIKEHWFNSIWEGGIGLVVDQKDRAKRDPFEPPVRFKARVLSKSGVYVDYRKLSKIAEQAVFRTAVFPAEF